MEKQHLTQDGRGHHYIHAIKYGKTTPLHAIKYGNENATTLTITSRPAKMKINNQPKLRSGLPFIDTVELVKARNVDHFQSQWLILNKTYRQLYSEYLKLYDHVSYGTFLNLKPFYIRAATTKDFEVCCCKLHLEVRWTCNS